MAGIYFHIPFCKKRCLYCDFYSTTLIGSMEEYVDALCRELVLRKDYLKADTIQTIYFGGGTPSQLQPRHFKRIFETLTENYPVTSDCEITIEANPDDLVPDYILSLRRFPFNRISLGVQSFDDTMLTFLNRRHTSRQATEAIERLQMAGFDNISIDLMYSLPGQTMAEWDNDLLQATRLGVQHISAYALTYEDGTALTRMAKEGKIAITSEEVSLNQYSHLIDRLTDAGYEHYEISNFALRGRESRHNSGYWNGTPYIGIGAAAHSFDGHNRDANIASLARYIKGITEGTPAIQHEELDLVEQYNDTIVTRLRAAHGLSLNFVQKKFGDSLYRHCVAAAEKCIAGALLEQLDSSTIRLTRKGLFLSDSVFREMIYV